MLLAMRDRGERIDGLLVTPTGDELPEVWEHWDRIAALVGGELIRPKAPTLRQAIDAVGGLPNFRMRWCTRMIKIEPMIAWARSQPDDVVICVGLRADEPERTGIISETLRCRFPLREYGMGLLEVRSILAHHEVRVPARTDCARCYHQRIGEWWDLWRNHPEIFADAIEDEKRTGQDVPDARQGQLAHVLGRAPRCVHGWPRAQGSLEAAPDVRRAMPRVQALRRLTPA